MAGSYNHVVDERDGRLLIAAQVCGMLECRSSDVYEAIEEMYGMIWFLADGDASRVEEARQEYQTGIILSPGVGAFLPPED